MSDVTRAADGLDPKQRDATVKLIDTKVEGDMKEVLTVVRSEMAAMRSEFKILESKISTGYTVFGIACGVITIVLAAIGLIIAFK